MARRSRAGYDRKPRQAAGPSMSEYEREKQLARRGLLVACRRCGAQFKVLKGEYERDEARCPACGGRCDRVKP